MKKSKKKVHAKEYLLSDDTVVALVRLGEVLRRVNRRLVKEGKMKIVDGKIMVVNEKGELEEPKCDCE